eukprot:1160771-Pelagomonas_calceolata.AAC.2
MASLSSVPRVFHPLLLGQGVRLHCCAVKSWVNDLVPGKRDSLDQKSHESHESPPPQCGFNVQRLGDSSAKDSCHSLSSSTYTLATAFAS